MNVQRLKQELLAQKENKLKGNIYHFSQVNFSYNSNRIEGSKLTKEETEQIFNTSNLIIDNDDTIETINHFKLFDYILENLDKPLSISMIIKMNVILKQNTSHSKDPDYNIGGFKIKDNIIGQIVPTKTSSYENVEKELNKLLKEYNEISTPTIEDIIDFHYKFELIHPFSDGNGRVGRIIMFKECLKNNIIPFIILNEHKNFYLRGLKEYLKDKLYLIDTIKTEQDIYQKICKELFLIN